MRARLTFFLDESRVGEQEVRSRLERLLREQFPDVEDHDLQWEPDGGQARGSSEDLVEKLERLDT